MLQKSLSSADGTFRNKPRNEEHSREEHNTPTTTHTHTSEGPHIHQQPVKTAISSLDVFLTPDYGHVGRNMCILKT
jgi:hypothetical protein